MVPPTLLGARTTHPRHPVHHTPGCNGTSTGPHTEAAKGQVHVVSSKRRVQKGQHTSSPPRPVVHPYQPPSRASGAHPMRQCPVTRVRACVTLYPGDASSADPPVSVSTVGVEAFSLKENPLILFLLIIHRLPSPCRHHHLDWGSPRCKASGKTQRVTFIEGWRDKWISVAGISCRDRR